MNRREFLTTASVAFGCAVGGSRAGAFVAPQLAVTMDDFNVLDRVSLPAPERSARILATLRAHDAQTAALVIGRFASTVQGEAVLEAWGNAGHIIGNHTYSHPDYHAGAVSALGFAEDFRRAHATLHTRRGFSRSFAFPCCTRATQRKSATISGQCWRRLAIATLT